MDRLADLKKDVCRANTDLAASGLVVLTWGNVSGVDRYTGRVVIKPSGVDYAVLEAGAMAMLSLDAGEECGEGTKPSSDAPTHLELYRAFPGIGGIAHTHSPYATSWAQACLPLPCLGTTHADTFRGNVPLCRQLGREEVEKDYEINVGKAIREHFAGEKLDPLSMPAVLVPGHGPFVWGRDAGEAVVNAVILEEVARLAFLTLSLRPECDELPAYLMEKHFSRKHGPGAYYGQG